MIPQNETADQNDPQGEMKVVFPKVVQPREHKAKVVIWADLTIDDVDRLSESLNVDHNKQVLADIFHLDSWRTDLKQAIVMDLYYYTLQFARENKFNREKTSTVFSIIKKTHEVCVETPFGNLDETFKYFKDLLLCHAVNRPPHSIELFTADDIRKITEYTINTYFRHFKMYKYAFTPLVRLDLAIAYHGVPVSPEPTEVGDADQELPKDDETMTEDQAEPTGSLEGELEQEADQDSEAPVDADESDARKELRAMIQNYLAEEIKRVKVTVEEQLKTTEDSLARKIESVEGSGRKSPRKDSAKKKK